ncbi:SDR family NAD(P)-dependent oxidoreductase [Ktedonosporobacter rubrisoli]|uniref:SDR family NAD(P)-dependent oxidoreductase n=1 Tax=Ktedonosporobacter rubrisoli TaxID=2509675 RepID=A0A4P6JTN7_KTERU|nr:SDR family NAD(P)-dependent oxidoreductase [Ktedonosporobacter rubrisoli]QBD78938.1 SDR family NAD(P)-dependent oxidoreductase [Ktedonosporobacter rubrisoli]
MMSTSWDMREKTVLVTGGTGGIGYQTAYGLAALGAKVIVVGRRADRGASAIARIQQLTGNTACTFIKADLAELAEVRRLAEYISTQYSRLHVLVNNIGARYAQREETAEGLEASLAINHLSPFLLTNLLLPLLEANAPARIVNVSSYTHRSAHINFADLQSRQNYDELRAYAQAKLANLLTSYELARRLNNRPIHINAADPGIASDTDLAKKALDAGSLSGRLKIFIGSRVFTSKRAAKSSIYLASSQEAEKFTGKYVDSRCRIVASSPASYDQATAQKVWDVSTELAGLGPESPSW